MIKHHLQSARAHHEHPDRSRFGLVAFPFSSEISCGWCYSYSDAREVVIRAYVLCIDSSTRCGLFKGTHFRRVDSDASFSFVRPVTAAVVSPLRHQQYLTLGNRESQSSLVGTIGTFEPEPWLKSVRSWLG